MPNPTRPDAETLQAIEGNIHNLAAGVALQCEEEIRQRPDLPLRLSAIRLIKSALRLVADSSKVELATLREEITSLTDENVVLHNSCGQYEADLARVTAEREEARTSRDEFKALASVGTWHKDCRPNRHKAADEIQKSQQRIDTLAEALTHAREEIASLTDENVVLHNSCGKYEEEIARLTHMITERVDTDHGRCHAGLQAAEAARDEARAALAKLREALEPFRLFLPPSFWRVVDGEAATPPDEELWYRIEVVRENGQFWTTWKNADGFSAGAAGPSSTPVGALADLCATLIKVAEDAALPGVHGPARPQEPVNGKA